MQAKINRVASAKTVIRYHDQKIDKGDARMIEASGFFRKPGELSSEHVLARFTPFLDLNERARKKIFHTSLSFHPDDKQKLSDTTLREVSRRFMKEIGLVEQPYLVYRHLDTAVPHVHIVCPLIDRNGERLPLPNVRRGSRYREQVRRIAEDFGLTHVKNRDPEKKIDFTDFRNLPQKVMEREQALLPAMAKAIEYVKDYYAYTSLSEFNGVLREYNVQAKPVRSVFKGHNHRGMVYVRLNDAGKQAQGCVPSSWFRCKPTLVNLERKFLENKSKHEREKVYLQSKLDYLARNPYSSMDALFKALAREHIATIIRHDSDDKIIGFTYVNHEDHSVFDDQHLEANLSASALLQRFGPKNAMKMLAERIYKEKDRATVLDQSRPTSNQVAEQYLTPAGELRPGSPLEKLITHKREEILEQIRGRTLHHDHSPDRPRDF